MPGHRTLRDRQGDVPGRAHDVCTQFVDRGQGERQARVRAGQRRHLHQQDQVGLRARRRRSRRRSWPTWTTSATTCSRATARWKSTLHVKYDCAGKVICDKGFCATSKTRAPPACGNPGAVCATGNFCTPNTRRCCVCTAKAMTGATCSATTPCQEALRCSGGTCTDRVASAGSCTQQRRLRRRRRPTAIPYAGNKCDPGLLFAALSPSCADFGGTASAGAGGSGGGAGGSGGGAGGSGGCAAAAAAGRQRRRGRRRRRRRQRRPGGSGGSGGGGGAGGAAARAAAAAPAATGGERTRARAADRSNPALVPEPGSRRAAARRAPSRTGMGVGAAVRGRAVPAPAVALRLLGSLGAEARRAGARRRRLGAPVRPDRRREIPGRPRAGHAAVGARDPIFGASELGARLPLALAAIGALLAVYWAGRSLLRRARRAAGDAGAGDDAAVRAGGAAAQLGRAADRGAGAGAGRRSGASPGRPTASGASAIC